MNELTETIRVLLVDDDSADRELARRALDSAKPGTFEIEFAAGLGEAALRLQPGDIGWLTQRHGELYVSEFGYDENFERFAAKILFEFQKRFDPATHRAFIASHGNVPLGSVFCEPGDADGWAKLRVFFVEPAARGLGLGQRLMDACLGFARDAGYQNMELYTLDNLTTARRLYGRNGFTCTGTSPQHFCGRDAVEEYWARAL